MSQKLFLIIVISPSHKHSHVQHYKDCSFCLKKFLCRPEAPINITLIVYIMLTW